VRVCFFTMGDNNEIASLFTRRHPVTRPGTIRPMGTLRQHEAVAAVSQLGLTTNDLVFLGYPDTGTLDIWQYHWRDAPPLQSMLTKTDAVPFAIALSPGAPYSGESIVDDLTDVIRDFRPTYIVVSHPADHNVDHRALALFTRVALWNLASLEIQPEVLAAPVHFTQWPTPRQPYPARASHAPFFLDQGIEWMQYSLAPYQVSNKMAALRRHHSQMGATPAYLQAFIRKTELFGAQPELSFPGGVGQVEIAEEDTSQFHPDGKGYLSLDSTSPLRQSLMGQEAAETRALQKYDNDFLLQTLTGNGMDLTMNYQFLSSLSPKDTLTVSLFAYQSDRPFGPLPKLVIEVRNGRITSLTDLDTPLPENSIERLPSESDAVGLRVPFALLGQPEKLLLSASLSKGSIPIDWTPWLILDCAGQAYPDAPAPAPDAMRSPEPVPEPAVEPPAQKAKRPNRLTPRVRLPKAPIPSRDEADEPVLW